MLFTLVTLAFTMFTVLSPAPLLQPQIAPLPSLSPITPKHELALPIDQTIQSSPSQFALAEDIQTTTDTPDPSPSIAPTPAPSATAKPTPSGHVLAAATISAKTATVVGTAASATPKPTVTATSRPTLAPTPQPTIASTPKAPVDLDALFAKYAAQYNVDVGMLKKIARCESGFNTNAKNLGYGGMFQFAASSWESIRSAMGLATDATLRFDPEEAIKTAAYMIAKEGTGAWPSCSK